MRYLEVFGVSTGVRVDVSNFFGAGAEAGVLKRGTGVESESEKCDSAHLCCAPQFPFIARCCKIR